MIADFWQYRVLKSLRKAFWLPYATLRRKGHAGEDGGLVGRTAYGVNMVQRWDDRTFVYCHGGIYGRFLADELERRRSPFTFVDLGANQGLYSLIAASNPACRGAIAFEPVAATHAALEANVAANGLENRITTHRLGVSDREGHVEIRVPHGHSGMASLSMSQLQHATSGRSERIQTIQASRLGELLEGETPLVVKVDVEGMEATVIGQLLASGQADRIEAVFYEVDTRWSDGPEIAAMLGKAGLSDLRQVGFGHHFDVLARRGSSA